MFLRLWLGAPWQQRRNATEDARLVAAAQAHAEELRHRELDLREPHGYAMHRGLDGRMPNARVRLHGYPLPAEYPDDLNMVESIAVQHQGPEVALAQLVASPSHTEHLQGAGWFGTHTAVGVGYAAPAWWVVVSAEGV